MYATCNLKPLDFPRIATFYQVFRRLLNSFNAIFRWELHCRESHRSEFQDKCLFVYLLSAEIFFWLCLTTKRFPFSFQKYRTSRGFCCLFTEIQPENHTFYSLIRAPCLKFWSPEGKSQEPLASGLPLGSAALRGQEEVIVSQRGDSLHAPMNEENS